MGKNSKRSSAEQLQEYRRKREQEEREKQKKQNRILMWTFIGILAVILVVAAIIGIVSHFTQDGPTTGSNKDKVELKDPVIDETNADYKTASGETDFVRLTVRYVDKNKVYRQGEIIVNLRPDIAPITVANFKKLVGEGFYNGLTFHRVYSGFMIQGGNGETKGREAESIKGEFASNGVENDLSHTRGVISMARTSIPNSASSEFFIMHADNTGLDGQYAAFGKVVSGMDAVDGIAGTPVTYAENSIDSVPTLPINEVTIVSAEFVEKVK